MDSENMVDDSAAKAAAAKIRSRIRGLWIGLAIWVFILVNALRVADVMISSLIPLPIFALGILANVGLIVATALFLRRDYRALRSKADTSDSA
jgi:hypothetical protein